MKKYIQFVTFSLLLNLAGLSAKAESVKFDPESPLYIEYKTKESQIGSDISLQIEDTHSPSKIRLSLQSKPESISTYYGYLFLQLGKKITNEVNFKTTKNTKLYSWLTTQDNIQALFIFDTEEDLNIFKKMALDSKKPLTDKDNLPQLAPTAMKVQHPTSKPIQEQSSEMNEVIRFGSLMNTYNAFTPEQKKINTERANQLSQSALKLYQAKNYVAAEGQFAEALKLDPSNALNRYYLGLCYYQNKKYERSLALLSLAEGAEYNYAEYKYYMGLNNLKLKKYSPALEAFSDAKDEKDADYSGPAAFFSGHIYFQKEDYAQARSNFEYSIDQSKNSKMDNEAEAMIEKIEQIESYKNQMKERFRYSLFMGFGYDSNVLNISSENLSTNLAAYRVIYGTNLNYKFFYNYTHDLSVDFNASDYYSVDNKFKSDSTVQSADPLQVSLGLPYHRRFEMGQRIYTWGFLPSYQTLTMSLDGVTRKKILDSTVIATDLNFAVSSQYYSKIYAEYSIDNSSIPVLSTAPETDSSANKITLNTTQTYIVSPTAKKTMLFDLGYTLNEAKGDNNDYNKIMAALTYSQMGFWNAVHLVRLDFANSAYSHISTDRKDNVLTATLGLTKDLTKKLSLGLNANYTMSTSNVDTYKYNKFGLQTMLNYSGAF